MKIALPGATGNVGTHVLAELLRHGHEVTGIARNRKKVARSQNLTLKRGNVKNEAELAKILSGRDAVIHSLRFQSTNPHKVFAATKRALLLPEKRTGKSRLGGNQLLVAENNESKPSMEHFAVALVDELERLTHSRQRLTVGY